MIWVTVVSTLSRFFELFNRHDRYLFYFLDLLLVVVVDRLRCGVDKIYLLFVQDEYQTV